MVKKGHMIFRKPATQKHVSVRAWIRDEHPPARSLVGRLALHVLGIGLMMTATPILLASALALIGEIGSGWSDRVLGAIGLVVGLTVGWLGARTMRRHEPW